MGKNTCHPCMPMPPLSDEAAVEILDFLHVFMTEFENRYASQIRRYYEERSRYNRVQHASGETGDPPF
jgi:hypothetical protein